MKKLLLAAIVLLALTGRTVLAQEPIAPTAVKTEPTLSAAEESEARAFAERFYSRLVETNSIGPLLKEFARRDMGAGFKRYLLSDETDVSACDQISDGNDEACLTAKTLLALGDDDWNRFYRDFFDLQYLLRAGSANEESADEAERTDGISPEALAVMRSNPQVAVIFDSCLDDNGFKSVAEFRQSLDTLEAGEAIMRADLQKIRASAANDATPEDPDPTNKELKIHLCDLDPAKYELPPGTRMIDVDLPQGIVLTMIRENGALRIISVEMQDN